MRNVLHSYSTILDMRESEVEEIGRSIPIPSFSAELIKDLCRATIRLLKSSMVEMKAPVYIIGDLHGNLFDLLRILLYTKTPPETRLVFLGDYVDRGQYSVEICTLLFALFCAYPDNVVLLRGNHEFEHLNKNYGFFAEVQEQWGNEELWTAINEVFSYLPLTAVVNRTILCVHGGISPQIASVRQLQRIQLPIQKYEKDDLVCDLVWSDPSTDTPDFLRSNRGSGVTFGINSVKEFFQGSEIQHIVRAHQCVPLGIERLFGDSVYTVFSCSNYVDGDGNRCGLLFVSSDGKIESFSLPALTIPQRCNAYFGDSCEYGGKRESLTIGFKLRDMKHHRSKGSLIQMPIVKAFGPRSMSMECLSDHKSTPFAGKGTDTLPPKLPRLRQLEPLT